MSIYIEDDFISRIKLNANLSKNIINISTRELRSTLQVCAELGFDCLSILNKGVKLLKNHPILVFITNLFSKFILNDTHYEVPKVEVSSCEFVSS